MMIDTAQILGQLKHALRARRITYRRLGASIGMSESGVKKLFVVGDCSLGRLIDICDASGIAFEDLVIAAAGRRAPARLTPAQEDFFIANPQCFYYLAELVERDADTAAVAAANRLDAAAERVYLTALERQGCLRVLASGAVRLADGFRDGIAIDGRVAQVILHAQQSALLEAARGTAKNDDLESFAYLGMGTLRLRRDTLAELKRTIGERSTELERRARREAVTTPPAQLVDVGMMTVLAPFKWGDMISLERPRIQRAARRPRDRRKR
jgi:hypothetical protein